MINSCDYNFGVLSLNHKSFSCFFLNNLCLINLVGRKSDARQGVTAYTKEKLHLIRSIHNNNDQNPGQPVSRILSSGNPAWMDIYLDEWLPTRSSGLPGDDWDTGRSRLSPDFSPA